MERINELRDYGDGQTVVLYSNDQAVLPMLRNYRECFKTVPYTQEQKKRNALIGYDFYFPKSMRRKLKKAIPNLVQEP